jgi:hypothetical protein
MAISPALPSPDLKAPILNSWKEIATYLGRGVRTVQRYERELQLPVRRVGGKSRRSVVALSQDLDTWVKYATIQKRDESLPRAAGHVSLTAESVADLHELRLRCAHLRAEHAKAVATLTQSLSRLVREIEGDSTIKRFQRVFCENSKVGPPARKAI